MGKKVDIWMPLYVADYISATSRLTTEQHGAYLLLLMDYWKNGAPPDNDQVLAQITKLSHDAWTNARTMLEGFFDVCDGHWFQHRLEAEMVKANHNKTANSKRGKAGAAARWGKKDASSIPGASLEVCSADSTSPSPTPSNNKRKEKATSVACPDSVNQQVWHDFLKMRKTMNKPFSETALKLIIHEAEKAGWSLENALAECCTRGWQSFKADWVKDKLSNVEVRHNHMAQLTRGLSIPKPKPQPFWTKSSTIVEEIPNVESKRLL
jgi:uncharacterized protein YdaU (DUF1376 family)